MRLSFLPVLVAGVGMIASQVAAEPIRVIVDTSGANANLRFGHVLANANVNGNDDSTAARVRPALIMATTEIKSKGSSHHWCKGSFRGKVIQLSNAFRHALGLPLIEAGEHPTIDAVIGKPHPHPVDGDEAHILPFPPLPPSPFEGTPESFMHGHHAPSQIEDIADQPAEGHPHHKEHYKHKKFRKHGCKKRVKGFMRRIRKAVTALGPWEGRAVSFVLGCGLGVLLRMFWVLSVLAYRTIRGEREEPQVPEYVVLDQDVETLFVAPPEYMDQKQASVEEE
ncbi:hypothetical protein J3A83DRAFT_4058689, partial [Scleroderma citrinum]